eukprot:scaffold118448_cov33-Tisochrysis_lutea.AAC.3
MGICAAATACANNCAESGSIRRSRVEAGAGRLPNKKGLISAEVGSSSGLMRRVRGSLLGSSQKVATNQVRSRAVGALPSQMACHKVDNGRSRARHQGRHTPRPAGRGAGGPPYMREHELALGATRRSHRQTAQQRGWPSVWGRMDRVSIDRLHAADPRQRRQRPRAPPKARARP